MQAENDAGEICYLTDGIPVIEGIFEDGEQADFITAQWMHTARSTNITEKFTARKLLNLLCNLRKTENPSLMKQVITLDSEIRKLDQVINEKEKEMNLLVCSLYRLTPEEIRITEGEGNP